MDLLDASTFFDDDPVYDGYSGAFLFNAQVSSFNDSHSDGATNRRRVISIDPALVLPTRQVIQFYGDRWVVGPGTPDGFYGVPERKEYNAKKATDLMALYTPNALLTAGGSTQAWVHKFYFKDTPDAVDSADITTYWNIFIAPGEPVAKGTFLKDAAGRLYRCQNEYLPAEGLRVCQSDTLDVGAFQSITWGTGAYNPISDAVAAGGTVVNAVVLRPPQFYRYQFVAEPVYQKGDVTVFVPATITPKAGDQFTMGAKRWRAVTVQAELDAWAVHARLV